MEEFSLGWGVPIFAFVLAGVGALWVYLSDKAFTRKYGPDFPIPQRRLERVRSS